MKILFFVDLHGDMEAFSRIKKKSLQADLVVCAGDISRMEENIDNLIAQLNQFGIPILIIHGNHEDEQRLRNLCESNENVVFLHKAVHHIDNYVFLGYGGDGFSITDPEFIRVANAFFKPESLNKQRIILVTHGPAYNTGIDIINGDPRGNKSYREFVDDIKPHLVISGHLHENAGKHHKIGRTLFINPGMEGAIVNI